MSLPSTSAAMPPFASALRLCALVFAVMFLAIRPQAISQRLLEAAAVAGLFALGYLLQANWRSAGALTLVAALLGAGSLRLRPEFQPPAPPASIRDAAQGSAMTAPDYRHSLRLQLRIIDVLRPGLYVAEFRRGYAEDRVQRHFSGRRSTRFRQGRPASNQRRAGRADSRSSVGANVAPGDRRPARRQRTRRDYRRVSSTFRLALNPRTLDLLSSAPFRVLVSTADRSLVEGCQLEVRFFGRGALQAAPADGFGAYLQRRGIHLRARISPRYHILTKDCSRPLWRGQFRRQMIAAAASAPELSETARGAMLALLLGRSGYLDRELRRDAALIGTLHLFAASGLHLAILFGCLHLPLALLFGARHPAALWPGLVVCAGFTLALGAPASLLRAMSFLFLAALRSVVHRRLPIRELLLHSAWFLFLARPEEFLSAGAALSFAAAGGILYYMNPLRRHIFPARSGGTRLVADQLSVSVAAGLLTAPLIQIFFSTHAWFSLPANLILVPLGGLLLPALYLGAALSVVLPGIGDAIVLWPAARLLALTLWLSDALAAVARGFPSPPLAVALSLAFCLWALVAWFRQTEAPPSKRRPMRLAALLLLALLGPPGAALCRLPAAVNRFDWPSIQGMVNQWRAPLPITARREFENDWPPPGSPRANAGGSPF